MSNFPAHAPSAELNAGLPLAPSLPTNHLLGHLPAMGRDPLELFERAHRDVGDVVRMRLGPKQIVTLAHPELLHRVLVSERDQYIKQTRGYTMLRLILGDGLVTSEGGFWRRQRRIAQPAFRRKYIAGFANTMTTSARDMADRWQAVADAGATIDVAAEMMQLTLRIAGETLFSRDLTGEAHELGAAVTTVLEAFSPLTQAPIPAPHMWPTPTAHKFRRGIKVLDRVVHQIIAERRATGEPGNDLLGMFMASVDDETGESMTDKQLRDEVMTMILAGHETTANALAWTLYLLSKHPAVDRRVHDELAANVSDDNPAAGVMRAVPYTHQALQESMRLYPPVWVVGRSAVNDTELGGYRIPQGTYVYMPVWVMHRHPALWDNPEGFDPDRFAPDRVAARKALGVHKFAHLPFSGGQRKCIGDHFAKMESLLILAVLLQRFRLSLVPGQRVVPEASITLRPRDGLHMRIHNR